MKPAGAEPEGAARAPARVPALAPSRGAPGRRRTVGAELVLGRGVDFRVWARSRERVAVVDETSGRELELAREGDGYYSGLFEGLEAGALYRYRLDRGARLFPDPASRFQPEGPHGPSEVVDPTTYAWRDDAWKGRELAGQVLYEVHPGTFSESGTWDGARSKLPHLVELGITTVELMPIAEFSGSFGWGYDGVGLYAPHHAYGTPDALRRFVDEAHALGLGVVLDVVYNHLGPDGNYLREFSSAYFSGRPTDWGEALNYDGADSGPVREFVTENAAYWISEFHLDGLRLDATQSLFDGSSEHVIAAIARSARAAAGARSIVVVAENEPQESRLVRPVGEGGYGLDALWNDDFHHTAVVALTGSREAYYHDYLGSPQELVSAVKHGFLFQGQRYAWQEQRRGSPTRGILPRAFIAYLENHDQVANSCRGERLARLASPGRMRAMSALLLLGPWTPMLFQGQEWSSSKPFLYFAGHEPELAALVRKGRFEFLTQFRGCATPEIADGLADPSERATFEASRLDWGEIERDVTAQRALALHRDLLSLRRSDPVLRAQGSDGVAIDGAVIADLAFVLRFFARDGDDRLLVVNLGRDLELAGIPEPLVAPPNDRAWRVEWSSEHPRYGGRGVVELDDDAAGWSIPGRAAALLVPRRST